MLDLFVLVVLLSTTTVVCCQLLLMTATRKHFSFSSLELNVMYFVI